MRSRDDEDSDDMDFVAGNETSRRKTPKKRYKNSESGDTSEDEADEAKAAATPRRSGRASRRSRKAINYADDDDDFADSADEHNASLAAEADEDEIPVAVIEKLLGRKLRVRRDGGESSGGAKKRSGRGKQRKEWHVLVKWKETAYMHSVWVPEIDVRQEGTRERMLLQRFINSYEPPLHDSSSGSSDDSNASDNETGDDTDNIAEKEDGKLSSEKAVDTPGEAAVASVAAAKEPTTSTSQSEQQPAAADTSASASASTPPEAVSNDDDEAKKEARRTKRFAKLAKYFDSQFLEVDRILASRKKELPEMAHDDDDDDDDDDDNNNNNNDTSNGQLQPMGTQFLVKWCAQSCKECTWEWEQDLMDDFKVAQFHRVNRPPAGLLVRPTAPPRKPKFKKNHYNNNSNNSNNDNVPSALPVLLPADKSTYGAVMGQLATLRAQLGSVRAKCRYLQKKGVELPSAEEVQLSVRSSGTVSPSIPPPCLAGLMAQAELCGSVRPGDEVVAVNGRNCEGMPLNKVTQLIIHAGQQIQKGVYVGRTLLLRRFDTKDKPETNASGARRFKYFFVTFSGGPIGMVMGTCLDKAAFAQLCGPNAPDVYASARVTRFLGSAALQENMTKPKAQVRKALVNMVLMLDPLLYSKLSMPLIASQCGATHAQLNAWLGGEVAADDPREMFVMRALCSWIRRMCAVLAIAGSVSISRDMLECMVQHPAPNAVAIRGISRVRDAVEVLRKGIRNQQYQKQQQQQQARRGKKQKHNDEQQQQIEPVTNQIAQVMTVHAVMSHMLTKVERESHLPSVSGASSSSSSSCIIGHQQQQQQQQQQPDTNNGPDANVPAFVHVANRAMLASMRQTEIPLPIPALASLEEDENAETRKAQSIYKPPCDEHLALAQRANAVGSLVADDNVFADIPLDAFYEPTQAQPPFPLASASNSSSSSSSTSSGHHSKHNGDDSHSIATTPIKSARKSRGVINTPSGGTPKDRSKLAYVMNMDMLISNQIEELIERKQKLENNGDAHQRLQQQQEQELAQQQYQNQYQKHKREQQEQEQQQYDLRAQSDNKAASVMNHLRGRVFKPYTAKTQPKFKHDHKLRDYQLDGVNWILSKFYEGQNCILADEMGLGKTVQVVTMIEHMRTRENIRGPYLVVAPLSTIGHWEREVKGWTDMTLCKYYDNAVGREVMRKHEWFYGNVGGRRDVIKFNVMVTTYETFMADVKDLLDIPWATVIIDEGHRLRSHKSKLLNYLHHIKGARRLLLTGTPIQNNMLELWTLLNFCDGHAFGNQERFMNKYGDLKTQQELTALQKEISPYMLRRVKEDVEKSIPPKEETIIDVELTMLQKSYYRAIFERNRSFLYKGCKSGNKPKLINVEMELRKCCNHPFLIAGVRDKEYADVQTSARQRLLALTNGGVVDNTAVASAASRKGRNRRRADSNNAGDLDPKALKRAVLAGMMERLVAGSGKLVLVDKLLPKLRKEGHKVLIFSQMVRMLDVLQEYCQHRGFPYERLDGGVMGSARQSAIDRFSKPGGDSFVFLLSTRAGGVGINLTAADTAIIFDSDFNPQNDAQAQARCHRIGQTKDVRIYRLVTKCTYEETMLDRAARKLGLERAVLGSVHNARGGIGGGDGSEAGGDGSKTGVGGKNMTPAELEKMLREGAYHHLMDQDDSAAQHFMEADIDQLMQTNARTVVVDTVTGGIKLHGDDTKGKGKAKTGAVTKRSFKADTVEEGAEVDLHDPDFWEKILPDVVTPDSLLAKLNDAESVAKLRLNSVLKATFMADVRELVEDILEQRDAGELVDQHDMDTSQALLVQVASLPRVFGVSDMDDKRSGKSFKFSQQASLWVEKLEASRERRCRVRTTKQPGGKGEDVGGDSSDDDGGTAAGGRRRGKSKGRRKSTGRATKPKSKQTPAKPRRGGKQQNGFDADVVTEDIVMEEEEEEKGKSVTNGARNGAAPKRKRMSLAGAAVAKKNKKSRVGANKKTKVEGKANANEKKKESVMYAEVCVLCAEGGSLVICDGECCRAFHASCLSEDNTDNDDADWHCPDCAQDRHNCLLCDDTSPVDRTGEHGVMNCDVDGCGRFYHRDCLLKSKFVLWKGGGGDNDDDDDDDDEDYNAGAFECPLHVCSVCTEGRGDGTVTLQCLRCPKAFHRSCEDRMHTMHVHENQVICPDHLNGLVLDEKDITPGNSSGGEDVGEEIDDDGDTESAVAAAAMNDAKNDQGKEEGEQDKKEEDKTTEKEEEEESEPDEVDADWWKTTGANKNLMSKDDLELLENDKTLKFPCAMCAQDGVVHVPMSGGDGTVDSSGDITGDDTTNGSEHKDDSPDPTTPKVMAGGQRMPLKLLPQPFIHSGRGGTQHMWVHERCAKLTPGIRVDMDGKYHNIVTSVRRGRFTRCNGCGRRGATVACTHGSCKVRFHVNCAMALDTWNIADTTPFVCMTHAPKKEKKSRKKVTTTKPKNQLATTSDKEGETVSVEKEVNTPHGKRKGKTPSDNAGEPDAGSGDDEDVLSNAQQVLVALVEGKQVAVRLR